VRTPTILTEFPKKFAPPWNTPRHATERPGTSTAHAAIDDRTRVALEKKTLELQGFPELASFTACDASHERSSVSVHVRACARDVSNERAQMVGGVPVLHPVRIPPIT
jgi:hypothetical protein